MTNMRENKTKCNLPERNSFKVKIAAAQNAFNIAAGTPFEEYSVYCIDG